MTEQQEENGPVCVCWRRETETDSGGLLSPQVLAIGHRNDSKTLPLLQLADWLPSLIRSRIRERWLILVDDWQLQRGNTQILWSLSLSLLPLNVCVCARTSVWEAAVFANVFPFPPPPRGGLGMCGTERKKERKRRVNAFSQLQCNSGLPPIQTSHWWVYWLRTVQSLYTNMDVFLEFPCSCDSSEMMWWTKSLHKIKGETVRKRQGVGWGL